MLATTLLGLFTTGTARAQLRTEWLTQFGTSANDSGSAIMLDASGRPWVAGSTGGSLGATGAGKTDLFLSRLSAGGALDFTRQEGGAEFDSASGVALMGNTVVLAGGSNSPTIAGVSSPGGALTMRFDLSGTLQGTTFVGSTDAATSAAGSLAGQTATVLMSGLAFGSFDGQTGSGVDAFLSMRNAAGAVVWTRFAQTSAFDEGKGNAVDSNGNGYLVGVTAGNLGGTSAGGNDIFVARYDSSGNRTLIKQFGTNTNDYGFDVAADGSGNIYLTGTTDGALNSQASHGGRDAFVMKLNSVGTVLWTRLFGTAEFDESSGLAIDASGNVWITGYSFGGGFAGTADGFVAKYSSTGALLDSVSLSTPGNDYATQIAIGGDGSAYVTGKTDGLLGAASFGGEDIWVAKIIAVPEPSTTALLAIVSCGLLLRRRHRARESTGSIPLPS